MAFNRKLFDAIHETNLSRAPKGAKPVTAPMVIWECEIAGFPIQLWRKGARGRQEYWVQYGKQFIPVLGRRDAQRKLASCIFHALECEGRLD